MNLKQIYGSTETTGLASLQPDGEADPNTAGRPCPGIEVRIGDRGEVLVKSPGIFKGYFKAEEATREVIDREGWFHTGDAGFIDPRGHLVIIDRAKDVGAMQDGTPFAPQFIENKLKYSPFIREAVCFGNERPFVAAMVAIDMNTVGNWAERRGLPYTSYMDLAQKPEVRRLLVEEIAKANATLPDVHPHPPLPPPHQGPRGRRRRDDPHPKGAPALRRREVRAGDRRASTAARARSSYRRASPTRTAGRPSFDRASTSRTWRESPPMSDALGFFFLLMSNGVLIGLMYSLIALGFVLVYKATDAVNFAQGEFVMIAGLAVALSLLAAGRARSGWRS